MYKKYIVVKFGLKKGDYNFNLAIFTDLCIKDSVISMYKYSISGIVLDTDHVYGLTKFMKNLIDKEGGKYVMPADYYEIISETNIKKEAIDAYDAELKKSINEIINKQSEELKPDKADIKFQAMVERIKNFVQQFHEQQKKLTKKESNKEIIKKDISKQIKKEKEIKEEKKMSIKEQREKQAKEAEAKAKEEAAKAEQEALKELVKNTAQATTTDDQKSIKDGVYKPIVDATGKIIGFGTKYNKYKKYPDGSMVLLTGNTPEELEADEKAADQCWAAHNGSQSQMQKQVMTAFELNEAEINPEEEIEINGKKYFIINKIELMDDCGKTIAKIDNTQYPGCEKYALEARKNLLQLLMKK